MSSTNRGTKRQPYDFYSTPKEVIENILRHIDLNQFGNKVLEPSAGSGVIVETVRKSYPDKLITSIEIRQEESKKLIPISDEVIIGNFLEQNNLGKYDIIIGNPPYSQALEFVKKSLELLNDNGVLLFLLRTAFLESKSRYEFWQKNPLTGLYTLSKRPSFTGKGTDSTSYSWFIWDKNSQKQFIKVI